MSTPQDPPTLQPERGAPSRSLGTLTDERPAPRLDDGDHERFAHYAAKDKITESMVTGTPITALCGKVWVPSRDPKRYPVCPECKEIYELVPPGDDGGSSE